MSEIRYDRLHDTHVVIAPERMHRPDCSIEAPSLTLETVCPFCGGNEAMTPPEIFALGESGRFANEKGWHTRVVPNLYKAVQIEAEHRHHYGAFEHWEGFGAHEIIIDTPRHHTSMMQWSQEGMAQWLKTLSARVLDLRRDTRIAYISLFKNQGLHAGATQPHSHTQLIGLPIVPMIQAQYYQRCFDFYRNNHKALLEDIIQTEEENATRIVATNGDFTAFCPYASAYAFEVIISSKKALGAIDSLSERSILDLSALLRSMIKRVHRQLDLFDFNLEIATPPLQEEHFDSTLLAQAYDSQRFFIRIIPRIYRQGGFEESTGVIINPMLPELAAKLLRESEHE